LEFYDLDLWKQGPDCSECPVVGSIVQQNDPLILISILNDRGQALDGIVSTIKVQNHTRYQGGCHRMFFLFL
jgi:hypothetical protein